MKIILSTYAFYPYAAGGTEVYTRALAEQLIHSGHQVLIIAGWDGTATAGEQIIWNDAELSAGLYTNAGVEVLGVWLKQQTVEAIYANEKPAWTIAFKEILTALQWQDAGLLLMNGVSTVSGVSLYKALLQLQPVAKLGIIVHTPFMCAKADMMFARKHTRCQQLITAKTCAACLTATNTGLPFKAGRVLNSIASNGLFSTISYSAFFRLPILLQLKITALQWLNENTSRWVVFSNEMRLFMEKQTFISAGKIKVIRHGIDKNIFYPPAATRAAVPAIFLYAGRFEPIKGVTVLCDAWRKLPELPAIRQLYLAGNWQQTDTGRQVHAALGKRADVVFMDSVPQQALADLYRQVHCVVIPSCWVETGPMVIHEAIECGCDIITTELGGQAELANFYHEKATLFQHTDSGRLCSIFLNYQPSAEASSNKVISAETHFSALLSDFLAEAG